MTVYSASVLIVIYQLCVEYIVTVLVPMMVDVDVCVVCSVWSDIVPQSVL